MASSWFRALCGRTSPGTWDGRRSPTEIIELIERMTMENPTWTRRRIAMELLKLGYDVSKDSVAKYMPKRTARPRRPPSSTWKTFVRMHLAGAIRSTREGAESRYRQFMDYVAHEFTGGRRFLDDLPREAVADDAELDAIAANADTARRIQ